MKKAIQLVDLQEFLMEAWIGIEPEYTAFQGVTTKTYTMLRILAPKMTPIFCQKSFIKWL